MVAGFAADDFWGLSPRMFQIHMAAAAKRAERDHRASMTQAYTTAALMRSKRLPRLDSLFAKAIPKQKPQSPEILQAMCEALAAAWGAQRKD